MKKVNLYILFIFISALTCLPLAHAVPNHLRFQGRLTDSRGEPIVGTPLVRFEIYDAATGGSVLWQSLELRVTTNDAGLFSAELEIEEAKRNIFFNGSDLFLQVWVKGIAAWSALLPRQPLSSVAFSFASEHARTAVFADTATTVVDGAVTASKIQAQAVGRDQLAPQAVGPDQLAPQAVMSIHLANEQVTALKISSAAVRSFHIDAGQVKSVHLSSDAVTSDNIRDASVAGVDISSNSISAGHLVDKSVGPNKVADGAIGRPQLNAEVNSALIPTGFVGMFLQACPAGWRRLSEMDGRLPMGSDVATVGVSSGSSSIQDLRVSQTGAHDHTVGLHNHSVPVHSHSLHHRHVSPVAVPVDAPATIETLHFPYDAMEWKTMDPSVGQNYLDNVSIMTRARATGLVTDSRPFSYLKTLDSDEPSTGSTAPSVTGNASSSITVNGGHTHAIESKVWLPPVYTFLFCVKE